MTDPTFYDDAADLPINDKVRFAEFCDERSPAACGTLPITVLSGYATLPTFGTVGSVGLDLYADMSMQDDAWPSVGHRPGIHDLGVFIKRGQHKMIHTGIAMAIPKGYYGQIAPRSGLAFKYGMDILAGVIDSDYRGEISVILGNGDVEDVRINHGDRIAQLLILAYLPCYVYEVGELVDTERGEGGFGSTGK